MRFNASVFILALWIVGGVIAPWLNIDPNGIHLERILDSPMLAGGLGYDDLGRPLLDRLIAGATTSFLVSLWVVGLSSVGGTLIGSFSAYAGGVADRVLVHVIDLFMAFPGILLAIALAGILGPGIENVVIALTLVGWVGYARLARAQVLSMKTLDHVQFVISLVGPRTRIVRRHLLPLITAPLIVEATFGVAAVVVAEAGLSFLGLGVQPPEASWGSMIRDGSRYLLVAPHMVIVPGVAMVLVVLAVNLLGDRLRDRLDVRSEGIRS
mgnify:FL=1